MWTLALQSLFIGLYLQVSTCYPSCTLNRLVADCASRGHNSVPALPPNITHLYLEMNYISEINSSSLRSYDQLQELDLGKQSVQLVIRNNSFLSQRRLKKLVLGFNIGLRMEPGAFEGLFNLQHLFLDYCDLADSILADSYLQPLLSLETLDLFANKIGKCLDLFDNLENLLGLNLSLNSLATLPQGIFRGLGSIIEIDLSSNALTYLQSDIFPIGLNRLDLSNNFLASPDPAILRSLSFLSLAANRFHCDCSLESFAKWLNTTNVTFLSPIEEYRCEFPAALQNLPLLEYSTIVKPCEEDDEKAVQDLKFALFLLSALLILTVVLSGIVYARLRGRIFIIYKKIVGRVVEGPKPPVDEVQHDAFLCFSDNDYGWVEAALLKKLDNQFSEENLFRCCFEARDFLPGEDHLSNIRDAIWGSRKTVCVVSKEFLKDGWCLEAFTLAQGRMLEELTNVLIMLVVGKVAHYQLMKYKAVRVFVQRREYLTWPEDPQDLEWFYERLVSQILRDTKVKELAEEKPEPDIRPHNEDAIQLEDIRANAV
ncbi:hypothetical protein VZT92_010561 [Zoarces viviparus]|uniref:TIR domain-containing protein n=1 Tax=Zoarces viviparus TaxID=48416 RepID=A0AAW1F9R3_ZOAVI